jgi:hypothetical protein
VVPEERRYGVSRAEVSLKSTSTKLPKGLTSRVGI